MNRKTIFELEHLCVASISTKIVEERIPEPNGFH